jgi:hypothetical protein
MNYGGCGGNSWLTKRCWLMLANNSAFIVSIGAVLFYRWFGIVIIGMALFSHRHSIGKMLALTVLGLPMVIQYRSDTVSHVGNVLEKWRNRIVRQQFVNMPSQYRTNKRMFVGLHKQVI